MADEATCRLAVQKGEFHRFDSLSEDLRGPRSFVACIALNARASAITLGTDIYVDSNALGRDRADLFQLKAHELAHVAQYLRDGTVSFLAHYLTEYSTALARGKSERRAYLDISYEKRAREVGQLARHHAADRDPGD